AHRVAPILDLCDRIAFELICEFVRGHIVLLASKITKQGAYKSRGYSLFLFLLPGHYRSELLEALCATPRPNSKQLFGPLQTESGHRSESHQPPVR
ncbi:MAG: hypothetical protein K9G71_02485, partial [Rhodobacteraceae bacterium]|nr:hypothetical protein [Paracoccaceae bacterium]MCF8513659.1 hypothetical protein [Paracoccaceae bacterium]MCF8517441.1 hypothetical protein [Paracoccaceae bacterium]